MHVPTGMVLIGSSVFSGLLALGLFVVVHRIMEKPTIHNISYLNDLSHERLTNLINDVKHLKIIKTKKTTPLLNYHHRHWHKLSHVELYHKNGKISRIHPTNEHEREALKNRINVLQSKLAYHKLPDIIKEN